MNTGAVIVHMSENLSRNLTNNKHIHPQINWLKGLPHSKVFSKYLEFSLKILKFPYQLMSNYIDVTVKGITDTNRKLFEQ